MQKVFVVSLLLVSIFLIGNAGVALADCQDYSCTGKITQYGEVVRFTAPEVELCLDEFDAHLYTNWFYWSQLYPAGTKNFLGVADTYYDWAGVSVEFKGNAMIVKVSYIQDDNGYVTTLKCTPCDNCFNTK